MAGSSRGTHQKHRNLTFSLLGSAPDQARIEPSSRELTGEEHGLSCGSTDVQACDDTEHSGSSPCWVVISRVEGACANHRRTRFSSEIPHVHRAPPSGRRSMEAKCREKLVDPDPDPAGRVRQAAVHVGVDAERLP